MYIVIDLIIDCVQAYFIANNQYFEEPWDVYFLVYALCLLPQFISLMLVSLYFCMKDSDDSRKRLPLAVILAFTTSILIALWITIYICFIYPSDDDSVMVGTGDKAEEGQEDPNYSKTSKESYLAWMLIFPILNITFYLNSYFVTKDWVRRNEGYRLSS